MLFTADPAVVVWDNGVYLYTGHDEQVEGGDDYRMFDYYLFESTDMVHWENKGAVVRYDVFSWARGNDTTGNANAVHVIERDDESGNPKFYFYAPVEGGQSEWGISIGVAVADTPEGPFEDARGIPLIFLADTAGTAATHSWRNLDPAVFVDDDGQAYLYWGNRILYWVKLEEDMIHLQGETYTTDANGMMQNRDISAVQIHTATDVTQYEEAPWISKHGGLYYLTYASGFPESAAHATSSSPEGPWQYRGVILDPVPNSSTIHPAVFEFCGACRCRKPIRARITLPPAHSDGGGRRPRAARRPGPTRVPEQPWARAHRHPAIGDSVPRDSRRSTAEGRGAGAARSE
jgi:hypothetical protein